MTVKFAPEKWLETAMRGLRDYVKQGLNEAILNQAGVSSGSNVYEVVTEFPESDDVIEMSLSKTLIHLAVDDIDDSILGFGEGHHAQQYDPYALAYKPQEAGEHRINLDVGVWASDRSGGVTARLRAYQELRNLFSGGIAIERLRKETFLNDGGLEILDFSGGRFIQETVNDIRLYRVIGCSLTVRCFSRTPVKTLVPTIEDAVLIDYVEIDDNTYPDSNRDRELGKGVDASDLRRTVSEIGTGTDSGTKTP